MKRAAENEATAASESRHSGGRRLFAVWDGGSAIIEVAAKTALAIGRSAENDLQIDHTSVSRKHAIFRSDDPPTIEDLGSSNGTHVGGKRIKPRTVTTIGAGAVVELGSATLLFFDAARVEPRSGGGDPMVEIERVVARVAPTDLSVLVCGETGVGKGVLAEEIHSRSHRAAGPFLVLNCGALPEALLDAELFGYAKGAYTGAIAATPGLVEAAHGGTLFLDEVAELSSASQVRLLRAVENREVLRLGEREARKVDVRFIAASHRDLAAAVKGGSFRQDLLFRLNGITITLPPLRHRSNDVLPIAKRFVHEACERLSLDRLALAPATERALTVYPWPGNIRELRNVIERAVILSQGPTIEPDALALPVVTLPHSEPAHAEREQLKDALARANGNQGDAARLLGISRRTLLRRLDEFALPRPRKGS